MYTKPPTHGLAGTTEDAVRLVIVGGDERARELERVADHVRAFPSARFAGTGSISRAVATISCGSADLVVLLCRWLGHSDYHAIVGRCRAVGVPYLRVTGGFSAARRTIRGALEGA